MSGIAGLWHLDDRPVDPAALGAMTSCLAHRGPDGAGILARGAVGLSCQHLWITPDEIGELQPLTGRSEALLVLDGRLDNRDELLPRVDAGRDASDAACLLAAFETWGDGCFERLNGDFAAAIFDPSHQRLLLARDAVGVRPLYYFQSARLFAFASEIKALLAHPAIPASPDDEGVADYLLMSARPVGGQEVTCFAGIRAVAPGQAVTVTPARVGTRTYWDFDTGRTVRLTSFDEYREAMHERFATAVRRRIRSARPVAVSLSGGLDSSSIFCQAHLLQQAGLTPCPHLAGVSYVGERGTDADEQQYLAAIEQHYPVVVDRFPIEQHIGLVEGAERQIGAIEAPLFDYMCGVTRELHRRARSHGARVLLSGTWGDQVLFSSSYLVDLAARLRWWTIGQHLREYRRWLGAGHARLLARQFLLELGRHHTPKALLPALKRLRRRLSPEGRSTGWYADAFRSRALASANQVAAIGDGFHSVQAQSIYLQARSKYHVHCLEWHNKLAAAHGLQAALPFMDRDLLAFLMAIPGDVLAWNGVPRGLFREAMRGVLPEPVRQRSWKADFTEIVNVGVARDMPLVAAALSPASLGVRFGYLDPAKLTGEVQRIAGDLARRDAVASWNLADLFGLEVWLQVFFGRQVP